MKRTKHPSSFHWSSFLNRGFLTQINMTLMSACESNAELVAGSGRKNTQPLFFAVGFFLLFICFQASTFKLSLCFAGTHCRPQLHALAVKHSVSQLVRAIMATAELLCLRDNTWLTWSTSEPDILLSLHHNTTTQTDMAGPLISRAGLSDLLCARFNGCMAPSNMPRILRLPQNTDPFAA